MHIKQNKIYVKQTLLAAFTLFHFRYAEVSAGEIV